MSVGGSAEATASTTAAAGYSSWNAPTASSHSVQSSPASSPHSVSARTHKHASCPVCRAKIKQPPSGSLVLSDTIDTVVRATAWGAAVNGATSSGSSSSTTLNDMNAANEHAHYRRRFDQSAALIYRDTCGGRQPLWTGMFRGDALLDTDDGVRRCHQCLWEVVGRECANCGNLFSDLVAGALDEHADDEPVVRDDGHHLFDAESDYSTEFDAYGNDLDEYLSTDAEDAYFHDRGSASGNDSENDDDGDLASGSSSSANSSRLPTRVRPRGDFVDNYAQEDDGTEEDEDDYYYGSSNSDDDDIRILDSSPVKLSNIQRKRRVVESDDDNSDVDERRTVSGSRASTSQASSSQPSQSSTSIVHSNSKENRRGIQVVHVGRGDSSSAASSSSGSEAPCASSKKRKHDNAITTCDNRLQENTDRGKRATSSTVITVSEKETHDKEEEEKEKKKKKKRDKKKKDKSATRNVLLSM